MQAGISRIQDLQRNQYFAPDNPSKCAIRRLKIKILYLSPKGGGENHLPNPTLSPQRLWRFNFCTFSTYLNLDPPVLKIQLSPWAND